VADQIEDEEIKRWLEATADPAADIAARAYSLSRLGHMGGELPKWNRTQWHNLPTEYREFLVSIARLAIVNAHFCRE
jgi:hypothetical protein